MKLLFVIILLSQVSCAAAASNFIVSTSSNLLSDSIGRAVEEKTTSDCKK